MPQVQRTWPPAGRAPKGVAPTTGRARPPVQAILGVEAWPPLPPPPPASTAIHFVRSALDRMPAPGSSPGLGRAPPLREAEPEGGPARVFRAQRRLIAAPESSAVEIRTRAWELRRSAAVARSQDPHAQPSAAHFLEKHTFERFGYVRASEPTVLFEAGGPSLATGFQGEFGDCFAVAAYASVIDADPAWVEGMFKKLPSDEAVLADGRRGRVDNYAVRFFIEVAPNAFKPYWVKVDDQFLTDLDADESVGAATPYDPVAKARVLHWALFEKAFAKFNDVFDVVPCEAGVKGFDCIGDGGQHQAVQAITGHPAATASMGESPDTFAWNLDQLSRPGAVGFLSLKDGHDLREALAEEAKTSGFGLRFQCLQVRAGDAVLLDLGGGKSVRLIPGHAYSVLGADERGRVILRNPWGWNVDDRGEATSSTFAMEVDDLQRVGSYSYFGRVD